MKLIDTSLYLSLIQDSFETNILPELRSPSAKAAADMIGKVLSELTRRVDGLPAQLVDANREGMAIAAEMRVALQGDDAAIPDPDPVIASAATDFDSAARVFAQLNADISAMAAQLSSRKDCANLLRRAAGWEAKSHVAFVKVPIPEPKKTADVDPLPREALEAFLKTVHPAGHRLRVTRLDRVPGGFGNQTYMAEIDDGSGKPIPLVIRKHDRNPLLTHPSWDMAREFMLLNSLSRLGYPSPRALWLGRNVAGVDADFMVIEKVSGQMIGSLLEGSESALPEGQMLEVAELLARLHSIELEQFNELIHRFDDPALLTDSIEQYNHRLNASWREYAKTCGYLPSPLFSYMLDWLDNHVPDDQRRPVLLHGDYGIHNMLGENGRVTAVLDWEGSMFGAPEFDLAFIQQAVSKHIKWERFLEHYIACGGREPAPDSFNYYTAFYNMRVLLCLNRGLMYLQNGTAHDIRFSVFEQGFIPHFMEQMLNQTA
jgi:aminoglycoside phosphotransferase (APT) family kinase protein